MRNSNYRTLNLEFRQREWLHHSPYRVAVTGTVCFVAGGTTLHWLWTRDWNIYAQTVFRRFKASSIAVKYFHACFQNTNLRLFIQNPARISTLCIRVAWKRNRSENYVQGWCKRRRYITSMLTIKRGRKDMSTYFTVLLHSPDVQTGCTGKPG